MSVTDLSVGQFSLVYNAFSLTLAAMGAATLFLWLGRSQVNANYKTALTISGLVTAIAAYHYFRIFENWNAAYVVRNGVLSATGVAFNDAYRYVDWLLTVPLLLIELVLVMRLPAKDRQHRHSSGVCRSLDDRPGLSGGDRSRQHDASNMGNAFDRPLRLHRVGAVQGSGRIHRPPA